MDRPTYTRPRTVAILLLLAAALPISGCKKQDEPAAPQAAPAVTTTAAVKRPVELVRTWTGALDGSQNVDVRPRVSGYLQTRGYAEGQMVKKGDPLFTIDPRPFEA